MMLSSTFRLGITEAEALAPLNQPPPILETFKIPLPDRDLLDIGPGAGLFANLNPVLTDRSRSEDKHLSGIILLGSPFIQDWINGILDGFRQFFHFGVNVVKYKALIPEVDKTEHMGRTGIDPGKIVTGDRGSQ